MPAGHDQEPAGIAGSGDTAPPTRCRGPARRRGRAAASAASAPSSATASRRSCSPSQASSASTSAAHLEPCPSRRPRAQPVLGGRADRDRARDRLDRRRGVDRQIAAHARAADADARRVDAVAGGEHRRHPADVAERRRAHQILALAVAALVVGDRRPAVGGAEATEVGVALLRRSGAVDDHHARPGRLGSRQPEPEGPAVVDAALVGGAPASAAASARLAAYARAAVRMAR